MKKDVKFITEEQALRYMPNDYFQKDAFWNKVRSTIDNNKFTGNFYCSLWQGGGDGYLYELDEHDDYLVRRQNLKEGERIYRYFTRRSAFTGQVPLIKINIDKGLLYFLKEDEEGLDLIEFETKGIPVRYLNIIPPQKEEYAEGGELKNYLYKQGIGRVDNVNNNAKAISKKDVLDFISLSKNSESKYLVTDLNTKQLDLPHFINANYYIYKGNLLQSGSGEVRILDYPILSSNYLDDEHKFQLREYELKDDEKEQDPRAELLKGRTIQMQVYKNEEGELMPMVTKIKKVIWPSSSYSNPMLEIQHNSEEYPYNGITWVNEFNGEEIDKFLSGEEIQNNEYRGWWKMKLMKEMADAGMMAEGGGIGEPEDYHKLNMEFLKIFSEYGFINAVNWGDNHYINEKGDILSWSPKSKTIGKGWLIVRLSKTYPYEMHSEISKIASNIQEEHPDFKINYESESYKRWVIKVYLKSYTINNLIKLFNEFNFKKGKTKGNLSFTPYYASGGMMADGGGVKGGSHFKIGDVVELKNIPENLPYEIRKGIIDNKWEIIRVSKGSRSMNSDIMEDVFGYDIELLDKKFKYKMFVYPEDVIMQYAEGGMMTDGGKVRWQDVYVGDNASVIAENKMGVVVKPYGRRFHLRFPDGTEKTYSAEELEFFKDEEYAEGGGLLMIPNNIADEIKKSISMGYDVIREGLISPKRKGIMLSNEDYKVRGTFPLELKNAIQKMIDDSKMKKGGTLEGGVKKNMLFDKNGERRIDPEAIAYIENTVEMLPQTKFMYTTDDGKYKPERKKLHDEIIATFHEGKPCIDKRPAVAILTGGAPASGKTTFIKKYVDLDPDKVYHVDADEVRAMLPEYRGWNATQTHLETADIVNRLIDDIGVPCDHDLIYDGTMNKATKYEKIVDKLHKLGYKVFVVYISIPEQISKERVIARYKKAGRYVPMKVIEEVYDMGLKSFEKVAYEMADGYIRIDGMNGEIIEEGGMAMPSNIEYEKGGKIDDNKLKNATALVRSAERFAEMETGKPVNKGRGMASASISDGKRKYKSVTVFFEDGTITTFEEEEFPKFFMKDGGELGSQDYYDGFQMQVVQKKGNPDKEVQKENVKMSYRKGGKL